MMYPNGIRLKATCLFTNTLPTKNYDKINKNKPWTERCNRLIIAEYFLDYKINILWRENFDKF